MKRRVELYRDIAIAISAICAAGVHLAGERWIEAGIAGMAGILWIVAERRRFISRAWLSQTLFLLTGLLLVWRFAEVRLWLTLCGIWGAIAATDLSRLALRFPVDSPLLDQRVLVNRRLGHLLLLAVATAAIVGIASFVTLQLRLVAIGLLALFVVMMSVRTVRSIAGSPRPGDDEKLRR